MRKAFRLDRRNGKFLGVCAGLANYTGLDANIIRICLVLLTFFGAFPWSAVAYFAAAWAAGKVERSTSAQLEGRRPSGSIHSLRNDLSETDQRMAEIQRYVASPNTRLAREIDELR